MPDPTHALRFAIQLTEAEGYPECAAGLRAAHDRLASARRTDIHLIEMAIMAHDKHEAALQSDLLERARAIGNVVATNWAANAPDGETWEVNPDLMAMIIQAAHNELSRQAATLQPPAPQEE